MYYTIYCRALFPCGDDLVCIIDDREDVWQGCGNLVQVKPYHFFRHTGDINAPPGLEKADTSRLSEPANINESCTNDSQNTDNKDDASEPLNEIKQSLDNPVKESNHEDKEETNHEEQEETNHEEKEDEKTETEMKETKNEKDENTKANIEEDAESNVQSSTAKEDDKTDKEVAPSVKTETICKDSKQATPKQDSDIIDEDDDDYLLYLEDILRRIHTEFYATLDQENTRKSLRDIIPRVRSQVLKGLCLTFSGLIPTHQKLHQSRAYKVARAFGAEVTQVINLYFLYLIVFQ